MATDEISHQDYQMSKPISSDTPTWIKVSPFLKKDLNHFPFFKWVNVFIYVT